MNWALPTVSPSHQRSKLSVKQQQQTLRGAERRARGGQAPAPACHPQLTPSAAAAAATQL